MQDKPVSPSNMATTRTAKVLLTVVAGLVIGAIAIWEWGLLAASIVLVTSLALMLCWTGRWKQVFSTVDGTIWWGGLLMWLSAFLTFGYGPMGGEIKQAALLRNVDLSWLGIGWLLSLSGIFWGATVATLAVIAIAVDSTRFISKLRYIAVAIWLVTVATGIIVVLWKFSDGVLAARSVVALVISAATIIALAIVFRCDWLSTAKAAAVHIVGALSLLLGLVPIGDTGKVLAELASYGIGYWMFCAGSALVFIGSAWTLVKARTATSKLSRTAPSAARENEP